MPIFGRFDLHIHLDNAPCTGECDPTYSIDLLAGDDPELQFSKAKIRRKISYTTVFGSLDRTESLPLILDALEKHLARSPWIELHGFRVDASLFDRLTERFKSVSFVACELPPGWWILPERPRQCWDLTFYPCSGVAPTNPPPGSLAWPELEWLWVRDNDPEFPTFDSWHANALTLVKGFVSQHLKWLSIDELIDTEFLTDLLPLTNLENVSIGGRKTSISNRLLRQIAECPRIKSLDFAATAHLPSEWAVLGKLKRLRDLDLWQTDLDDEGLSQILRHARLTRLTIWYTKITAQSWPLLLNHHSLRVLWASMELLSGPIPELPESTQLRTFMALNAKVQLYRDLLSRYPQLEVDWT